LLSLFSEDSFMRRASREIGTNAGVLLSRLLSFKLSTTLDNCAIADIATAKAVRTFLIPETLDLALFFP
jgi:hypothetical protein